jgi:hypothetical protein
MAMAQVLMPITQVQLDMYSFSNNEQINDFLKHSLLLSFNQVFSVYLRKASSFAPKTKTKCSFGMRNSNKSVFNTTSMKTTLKNNSWEREPSPKSSSVRELQIKKSTPSRFSIKLN